MHKIPTNRIRISLMGWINLIRKQSTHTDAMFAAKHRWSERDRHFGQHIPVNWWRCEREWQKSLNWPIFVGVSNPNEPEFDTRLRGHELNSISILEPWCVIALLFAFASVLSHSFNSHSDAESLANVFTLPHWFRLEILDDWHSFREMHYSNGTWTLDWRNLVHQMKCKCMAKIIAFR